MIQSSTASLMTARTTTAPMPLLYRGTGGCEGAVVARAVDAIRFLDGRSDVQFRKSHVPGFASSTLAPFFKEDAVRFRYVALPGYIQLMRCRIDPLRRAFDLRDVANGRAVDDDVTVAVAPLRPE